VITELTQHICELDAMQKYPSKLYCKGNTALLMRPKVSIVGTRKPTNYTREMTYQIAKALANRGVCVVSGGAMGVDAIAHNGAGAENTIAIAASGLDIRYPVVNSGLIRQIEEEGLMLSQFAKGVKATNWSFVVRNELVVALGEILVVTEAAIDSGSMRSVEYAQKMQKEIYVLPHRLDESLGTNALLARGEAKPIYDIEGFASRFGKAIQSDIPKDDFYYFCQSSPTLDVSLEAFGERIYEAELEGIVMIENGIVRLV